MGRLYTVEFEAIAIVALQDLFTILAPADGIIYVHGFEIFQTTDLGDSEEEILRIETVRGVGATISSGGAAATPQPVDDGDSAFGGTARINDTTRMVVGGGSLEELEEFGWNIRIPLEKIWTPETRPLITPSEHWSLSLPAAPTDSLTSSGKLTLEECGG